MATLQVLRDGRSMNVPVKLAERPQRDRRADAARRRAGRSPRASAACRSACRCASSTQSSRERLRLPDGSHGVIVSRVEPMSPAFDAEIERGHVLLEINRQPVRIVDDYRRAHRQRTLRRRPDALRLQARSRGRELHTVKVD